MQNLQGHPLPGTGEAYTNMVHKDDCVRAINYVHKHHLTGVYNLADDDHPTRKELYDLVAEKTKLPKVQWDASLSNLHRGNKRISNHKIKSAGYSFEHPHRVIE
jgi:nucleoside-diphosphate-sugar epimerase